MEAMDKVWITDPHIQCLHDCLDREPHRAWGWRTVYVFGPIIFRAKRALPHGSSRAAHEAYGYLLQGVRGLEDYVFILSLYDVPLHRIYEVMNLKAEKVGELIRRNYGWVDPDEISAILIGGTDSRRAFEDPKAHSPKRALILKKDGADRLLGEDPHCFHLALGMTPPRP